MTAPALDLRFPTVTAAALDRECVRELAARRSYYRQQVERARMTPEEQARGLAMASAWLEDVRRIRRCWIDRPGTPPTPPEHGISWRDRRGALLRELDQRRRFYPQWIASNRLLEADANHQLTCLECLLAIYEGGWDWRSSAGVRTCFGETFPSAEILQARAEWDALQTEIAQRNGQAQEEMAL